MKQLTHNNNFIYLCGALVALLFSASLVQEFSGTWGEDIFSLVSILMLIVSIKSVHTDMTWKKTIYVLVVLLFSLSIFARIFAFSYSIYLNLMILLLFFIGSFWTAYRQILFEGKVDTNKMIGSLSLYLLLGLMWTILYLILIE